MKRVMLVLFFITICAFQTYAQKQTQFKIQVELDIVSDRLKTYEDPFTSYLRNALAKIPDVKQVNTNPAYYLQITLFGVPCECHGFDFYYRAHFFKKDFKDALVLSPLPITEGFKSIAELEGLANDIVATVNVHTLQKLR